MSTHIDRFLRTSAAHLGVYTPQEDGTVRRGDMHEQREIARMRETAGARLHRAADRPLRTRAANDGCVCC